MKTLTVEIPSLGSVLTYQPGFSARGFPCQIVSIEADQDIVDEILSIFRSHGFSVPDHTEEHVLYERLRAEEEARSDSRAALEEAFEDGYEQARRDYNLRDRS